MLYFQQTLFFWKLSMTDLNLLDVSLTKHGAHKLAILLQKYSADDIQEHLSGSVPRVNIDRAQARGNLSVQEDGGVPAVWNEIRNHGDDAIRGLVLIAIIFSHRDLIQAMSASTGFPFRGKIVRGEHLDGKAYTNFAHTLDQLGFAAGPHPPTYVEYDLEPLFAINGLNTFALELLALKLKAANWDGTNGLIEELVESNFHEVFSITKERFRNWLIAGSLMDGSKDLPENDLLFFSAASDSPAQGSFAFKSGHRPRKTGTVGITAMPKDSTAELLHNAMQTKLYDLLVAKYGEGNVGTEIPTGSGTYIDAVVYEIRTRFYEIKTADTVKGCIRQALPQLLEYAYWNEQVDPVWLVIVGPCPITREAERYLAKLREKFGLPIEYEHLAMP
jgi:hypothetical protein